MKVGSEPKVHQQQQVEEPKDTKGPKEQEAPKDADQGDTFEDPKPEAPVDLGDMRQRAEACDQRNEGKPPPEGKPFDMDDPQLQEDLKKTEEGQRMLDDWNALKANGGMKVQYHDFCGAADGQWDPRSRTISINPAKVATQDGYYQFVAHEMTHASQGDGLNPERDGTATSMDQLSSADAWADHEMENEARAEARAFDVARSRGFAGASHPDIRKVYDDAMDAGLGRDEAIHRMVEAMKANPKWQGERQTYVNDWERAHPPHSAASGGVQ